MSKHDISTDGAVHECFRTDKFDSMEQIHQNAIYSCRSLSDFLLNLRPKIQVAEWSDLEPFWEFEISIWLGQMSYSDQTKDSDFEKPITSILTHENIDSESRYSAFDLNVEPDQILSVQEHQRNQLLVDVLWKRLKWKSSDVSLHET